MVRRGSGWRTRWNGSPLDHATMPPVSPTARARAGSMSNPHASFSFGDLYLIHSSINNVSHYSTFVNGNGALWPGPPPARLDSAPGIRLWTLDFGHRYPFFSRPFLRIRPRGVILGMKFRTP